MTAPPCPPIDELLGEAAEGAGPTLEHAKSCPECAAALEEHRQLEKDLYRLADPLPPPDFVHRVMARVATEPARTGSELKAGVAILGLSLGLGAASLFLSDAGLGSLGLSAARLAVDTHEALNGLGTGMSALWRTAAVPITLAASLTMLISLLGLRRLAELKVP